MVKSAMNQTVEGTCTAFIQHVGTPMRISWNNVQTDKEGSFTLCYPLLPQSFQNVISCLFCLFQHFLSFFLLILFIYFFNLAMPCDMWDLSSLTRDRTWGPWVGSVVSYPLNSQGSSCFSTFGPPEPWCSLPDPHSLCWAQGWKCCLAAGNPMGGRLPWQAPWQLLPGDMRVSPFLLFVLPVWSFMLYMLALVHQWLTSFILKWALPVKTKSGVPEAETFLASGRDAL